MKPCQDKVDEIKGNAAQWTTYALTNGSIAAAFYIWGIVGAYRTTKTPP